jgi:transcriptional regulator with GAF, ATPase, and Fis domain
MVLSPGPVLTLERDLFPSLGSSQPAIAAAVATGAVQSARGEIADATQPTPAHGVSSTLEDVERRHILEVLDQMKWVIEGRSGAAQVLNLHPNTLRSRMKKLGIQRTSPRMS